MLKRMIDQHYMAVLYAGVVDTTASQSQLIPSSRQFSLRELTELSRMEGWLLMWFNISYNPKTTSSFDQQLISFSRMSGKALDTQFMQYVINYDTQEIALAQQVLAQAGHADLKTLANLIISDDQSEIRTMQAWLAARAGTTTDN